MLQYSEEASKKWRINSDPFITSTIECYGIHSESRIHLQFYCYLTLSQVSTNMNIDNLIFFYNNKQMIQYNSFFYNIYNTNTIESVNQYNLCIRSAVENTFLN